MAEIPFVSREMLYVEGIVAFDPRSVDGQADPTTLPAYIALVNRGVDDPPDDAWQGATWTDASTLSLLVGASAPGYPGPGYWAVWIRIAGVQQEPRRLVGYLTFA